MEENMDKLFDKLWEYDARFVRWFCNNFLCMELTFTCKICNGILPIDANYINNHIKMHKESE